MVIWNIHSYCAHFFIADWWTYSFAIIRVCLATVDISF